MQNLNKQYKSLLEGNMTQIQFLRNARMMFPEYINGMNSYDDTINILSRKNIITENINELSANTYDAAAANATHRGQNARADKFTQAAGETRASEFKGVIVMNDTKYPISKVSKTENEIRVFLGNDTFIGINQHVMVYRGDRGSEQVGANTGDTPRIVIDRKTANLLIKIAKEANFTFNLDSFNVKGIHSENQVSEMFGMFKKKETEVEPDDIEADDTRDEKDIATADVKFDYIMYKIKGTKKNGNDIQVYLEQIGGKDKAIIKINSDSMILFKDNKGRALASNNPNNRSNVRVDFHTVERLIKIASKFGFKFTKDSGFALSKEDKESMNEVKRKDLTIDRVNPWEVQQGLKAENDGKPLVSQEEFDKVLKKVMSKLEGDTGYYTKQVANYKEKKVSDQMKTVKAPKETVNENLKKLIGKMVRQSSIEYIDNKLNKR